jgi:hypothetical protein
LNGSTSALAKLIVRSGYELGLFPHVYLKALYAYPCEYIET